MLIQERQQIQLRVDVTYIVAGVLLRNCELDENRIEVLMVQEAKASCRGRWVVAQNNTIQIIYSDGICRPVELNPVKHCL
jgi:hypothetical protein